MSNHEQSRHTGDDASAGEASGGGEASGSDVGQPGQPEGQRQGPHGGDAADLPPDPLGEATEPLDLTDPRFTGFSRPPAGERSRELIASRGPGHSPMDARVRVVRLAIPAIAIAGIISVAAVFWTALAPESAEVVVGDADAVASAVADRPLRVCPGEEGPPCAWLTLVDGELLALDTSGPIGAEFGRQAVKWCPSSGYFGSNTTDSRYDPAGRIVTGPARRGLDRFELRRDDAGRLIVDFSRRTAGPRAGDGDPVSRSGPPCDEIPFDRNPDLELPSQG